MRTEAILLIRCNCFEMWWPGTELNRRRQPFQGCALPPELPGHVVRRPASPIRGPTDGQSGRACTLTGRDCCEAQQSLRCNVRNPCIIATYPRSLKIVADNCCTRISVLCHALRRVFFIAFRYLLRNERRGSASHSRSSAGNGLCQTSRGSHDSRRRQTPPDRRPCRPRRCPCARPPAAPTRR